MGESQSVWQQQDGVAAVEFALVLLPLMLLLGGIIDFGFGFNAQIGLTHAAREGVRVEALQTDDGRATALNAYTPLAVRDVDAQVARSCPSDEGASVRIWATYDFFILSIIPGFDELTLQGQAVMRCGG